MGKIKKTLTTIGIWLAAQLTVTTIFVIATLILKGDFNSMLAPALLVSDTITIIILFILKYCKVKELFQTAPQNVFLISMIMGFCSLFAVDLLAQPLDIPDIMEQQFKDMSKSLWGLFAICIIGPISEEIMMRRVILTEIKEATGSVWWGIIISAALFAIIHVNPIQVIFAMPAGIVLGWLYCKTGRLLVPICVHILNNTFSFILMRTDTDFEIELKSTLGIILLSICILITLGSIVWMVKYYSGKDRVETGTDETINEEPAIPEEKTGSNGAFSGDNYEK